MVASEKILSKFVFFFWKKYISSCYTFPQPLPPFGLGWAAPRL